MAIPIDWREGSTHSYDPDHINYQVNMIGILIALRLNQLDLVLKLDKRTNL